MGNFPWPPNGFALGCKHWGKRSSGSEARARRDARTRPPCCSPRPHSVIVPHRRACLYLIRKHKGKGLTRVCLCVFEHPSADIRLAVAEQVLKQRKLYESQREQLYQQQFNLEQTRFTVDSIKDTVTSVQVGRQGPWAGARGWGCAVHRAIPYTQTCRE